MSRARLVVTAVLVEGRSRAEVARDYGISRRWVGELVKRYQAGGDAGLEPRSRRPHSSPTQVPRQIENEIVRLRKELADEGLDAGATTIVAHLDRAGIEPLPAVSTVWRVLTRRGLVTPQPQKRPKSSYTRFEADQPNELWQADITHWPLADGTDAEILNILDDHSRLLIGSFARTIYKAADVVDDFDTGFARHGLPAAVLTDNGAVFAGAPRGGRVQLERHLDALKIRVIHSRPYHPQTCGKVERFHQTLKKRLRAHDLPDTINQLQTRLDTFTEIYNHQRPHRALGRRTPAQAYTTRPKTGPDPTLDQTHWRIRHDHVDRHGKLSLRNNSRMHHIGIGRDHAGTQIIMLIHELDIRIIHADTGELLRELTLDPTRDYQPTGRPRSQPRKGKMSRDT